MRNLEFRVFNKETNTMHYQQGEVDCYDDAIVFDFNHFDLIDGINDLVVMQKFTPSLGIDVFEDDLIMADCKIVGHKEKRQLCKVMRSDRGMSIGIYYKGEFHAYRSMDFSSIEVVGNIHENSELLNT